MADIENSYLTAPITEKVWTVLGPEYGDVGTRALFVRALYGLKYGGAAFRNHLAEFMKHLGWTPSRADCDIWMKAETHPADDVMYWAYILIYVDDFLCVHHDPGTPLAKLDEYFKMKEGSIQVATFYVGEKLKKTVFPNGVVYWIMSSSKCVEDAVQNLQEYMESLVDDNTLLQKPPPALFTGLKRLSLTRVLSWTLLWRNSSSHILESCAGMWSRGALTSSPRCQCCHLTSFAG
jgi:hypothetical protein